MLGGAEATASDEDAQRGRLTRNRRLATGLLAGMAALYGATYLARDPAFLVQLVRAGAEAGIVGGLADWFAVTALFRKPFGLPIPHTAIIPANKDRIGRALGRFVQRHFLTEDVLMTRLRRANAAQRLAEWLAEPDTAPALAASIAAMLPRLIGALEHSAVHDFAHRTLGAQLKDADLAPLIGRAIKLFAISGEADILFQRAMAGAEEWVREREDRIDSLVRQRSRWWIPKAVDHRISAALVDGILDLLHALAQPDSDARLSFRAALAKLSDDLVQSPEQRAMINASKDRFINHPDVQAWLASIWKELSRVARADIADPSSKLRAAVAELLGLAGRILAADPDMQRHLDHVLERLASRLFAWRAEIGGFIADVVTSWDTRTVSERLELVVGTDLQYIRMNGTIVGALAGCAIFLSTWLLR